MYLKILALFFLVGCQHTTQPTVPLITQETSDPCAQIAQHHLDDVQCLSRNDSWYVYGSVKKESQQGIIKRLAQHYPIKAHIVTREQMSPSAWQRDAAFAKSLQERAKRVVGRDVGIKVVHDKVFYHYAGIKTRELALHKSFVAMSMKKRYINILALEY